MDKITKVNVEGDEYGFVAGQTVKGVSGALASDYIKYVILPEGAEVVEGMLIAVTFVNDNTAGYSGEKTVYSTDGINFYWDSGYTQLIALPPQGCYTVTETETQYEYKLSEYPVLVMGDMTKPFCDSRGHPAGGKLWRAGDTVTVINLENRFIALQTTVNEIIQGSSLPVSSGAVYEKCNSLEPVDHVTSGNLHSVTSNAVAGAISSLPYGKFEELSYNADMNNYLDPTKIFYSPSTAVINSFANRPPFVAPGEMAVITIPLGSMNYCMQLYFGKAAMAYCIASRIFHAGTGWSDWAQII